MFRFSVKIGLFLLLLGLFLEGFFRVAVPASSRPVSTQEPHYRVMQYDSSGPTDGLYTSGRQAQHQAHWRVNNFGWISAEDYTPPKDKIHPRAVVIGNSYVESIHLDVEKHLAPATKSALGSQVDFYTLGAWGVDLGQGIIVTDYAREILRPDLVILVLSNGSLRRTVRNFSKRPYCFQVEFGEFGLKSHEPNIFTPNKLRYFVQMSATLRYLRANSKVTIGGGAQQETAFVKINKNSAVKSTEQIREQNLMELAALWIVDTLEERNPETKFLFLIDGNRKIIHSGQKPTPIPASGPIKKAVFGRKGFYALDLTEALWTEYKTTGIPLYSEEDYHWNEHSVQIISKAMASFISAKSLLAK